MNDAVGPRWSIGDVTVTRVVEGTHATPVGVLLREATVETLAGHRSPAVIMANHGVFAIGRDARAAVKAAVMCEDVARSTHLARQLGPLRPLPQDDVDALFDRYQNVYGQR